jgi:large subunit ribosomal protein L35
MPKLKSNSGAKKRFSITKKGKGKRASAFARHLLASKSPGRKRKLRGTHADVTPETDRIKRMLPYA